MRKLRVSLTVLALLGFTLILFYQNCSQQSEDLGVGSITPGPGGGGNNGNNLFDSQCRRTSTTAFQYQIIAPGVGEDVVVCASVNLVLNTPGCGNANQSQKVPLDRNGNPVCPPTVNGFCSIDANYSAAYGNWIHAKCPCVRAAYNASISGYEISSVDYSSLIPPSNSNNPPTANTIYSIDIYFKSNDPAATNYEIASCQVRPL